MRWNVKTLGRVTEDGEGTLWMGSAASEISFTVENAGFLSFDITGDGTCREDTPAARNIRPRLALDLDGVRIMDLRPDRAETEITAFSGEKKGNHTLRLVKLSECSQSLFGIREIRTDGTLRPLPEKKLKMEFIGDSITCGYGVEGTVDDTFSTTTENAEKAYAYLAAQSLGADAVMTAVSGCGLLSGWTAGDINRDNLMQPFYETVLRNDWTLPDGRRLQEIPWDFSSFVPDWIIINLGNNDLSWTRGIPEREAEYGACYRDFLTQVRKNNPRSRILCVQGVLGDERVQLTDTMIRAVEQWKRETGDEGVFTLRLPQMNEELDGAGADHHPSEKTQRMLSELVAGEIRRLENKNNRS